jgi:hypothetical protein
MLPNAPANLHPVAREAPSLQGGKRQRISWRTTPAGRRCAVELPITKVAAGERTVGIDLEMRVSGDRGTCESCRTVRRKADPRSACGSCAESARHAGGHAWEALAARIVSVPGSGTVVSTASGASIGQAGSARSTGRGLASAWSASRSTAHPQPARRAVRKKWRDGRGVRCAAGPAGWSWKPIRLPRATSRS